MRNIADIGSDWLADEVEGLTDEVRRMLPSEYNELNRYLPPSVTSQPGYIRYAVNPYMREIVDCFSIDSPIREINVKKGVQITYSTVLESGVMYFADYIGTLPMMYITADKELAEARIEGNFLPMFHQSDKSDIIQSSDIGNPRKTGQTKNHLQFAKGAYLLPFGAKNADKMRQFSIAIMLKDELDGWPDKVGKDGDPDKLSDARTDGYTETAKIFRGSTPLLMPGSKIQANYLRGDQRIYRVLCRACSFPQQLRWETKDKETGLIGGFYWESEGGILQLDSVAYMCQNCGHKHYEHDKTRLFATEHGAHWHPTATPADPFIRSYHIPALYSPVGMRPWWKCVSDYIEAFDVEARKPKDIGKYQVFYNNVLAEPFKIYGANVSFRAASMHRRTVYRFGQIPNKYAADHSGSPILFLTCQVDVHKENLAVTVFGWCRDQISYVIDYWRFEIEGKDDDCSELTSPVWARLRTLIEETTYTADDGRRYRIVTTLNDSSYANATVCTFCGEYSTGVYPILGRDRPSKNQTIKEFAEFTTQVGTVGYRVTVDHYKDRLAPVLRREWMEDAGPQKPYHFNVPVDVTNKQLTELTVETRQEKTDEKGHTSWVWHRPGGAPNELWDLLVYGHAAVEILAWSICIQHFELKTIDWPAFWDFAESTDNDELFGRACVTGNRVV